MFAGKSEPKNKLVPNHSRSPSDSNQRENENSKEPIERDLQNLARTSTSSATTHNSRKGN